MTVRFWGALAGPLLIGVTVLGAQEPAAPPPTVPDVPAAAAPGLAISTGRISGQIIDKDTGRPIPGVRVTVLPSGPTVETDLDGRYRTPEIPVGPHRLRAALIGFTPVQIDSVVVLDGKSTVADITMAALPLQMTAIVVEAAPVAKPSSDAGLLAVQQAAPAVTDGLSAQTIARSPDANAGEALRRVTGVSVLGERFLVCRGLGERYSTALLNGAELADPVVEKKLPPLDLFPAGLIASVVAAKTATPDKPGDFAGCQVDLVTKDFPESRILQFSIGQQGNSNATFQFVPLPERSGTDYLAIDNKGMRQPPPIPFGDPPLSVQRGVLQGFQDQVWNPVPQHMLPGLIFGGTYGNQWQGSGHSFGALLSLSYNSKVTYTPDRIKNIYLLEAESHGTIDWGGVANFSYKLGTANKFTSRTMYTRSGDLISMSGQGPKGSGFEQDYLVRYIERYLWQTQLVGEHRVWGTNVEWRGTYGHAAIDDPDNHYASYLTQLEPGAGPQLGAFRAWRSLDDLTRSGQLDWSVPISLRRPSDALFKFGGYYRAKTRDYDGRDLNIFRNGATAPSTGVDGFIETLPPDQALAPEYMGSYFAYIGPGTHNDPFFADDNVGAAYGMLDVPVLRWLRLVGGVRVEHWHVQVKPGGNDPEGNWLKFGADSTYPTASAANAGVIPKDETDPLWSANLTATLNERMNLRFAAYRTTVRPDSREIAPGSYNFGGPFGACTQVGNPDLNSSLITNGDFRWEMYPRPGEIVAVSGFYKYFKDPIWELRTTGSNDNPNNICSVVNGESADLKGLEFEVRRLLDFLPGIFSRVGAGVNLTLVDATITPQPDQGINARRFIGQSPIVVNSYLSYEPPGSHVTFSVLYNYFGQRIATYANKEQPGAAPYPNPNWVENGRGQLDAKMRLIFNHRMNLSISGKNLTQSSVTIVEDAEPFQTVEHYDPGITLSLSLSYDF